MDKRHNVTLNNQCLRMEGTSGEMSLNDHRLFK